MTERSCVGTPPNKALQLTSAEHIERSQLNAGVRRTSGWRGVKTVLLG